MRTDTPAATRRPNLIFVFGDQWRASALGCAGVEQVRTPHLDAFAREGTRFTRAVSNTPCCCPARATLMTGRHVLRHELVNNDKPLRLDLPTLARELTGAGYRCGYVGKWHLDHADRGCFTPPGPRRLGFDDYWAAYNCNHEYFAGYYYENDDPFPRWVEGYLPDTETELASQFIRTRAAGPDPFCLALSWGPPHCPYLHAPREYLDMYPPESIELKPNAPPHADRAAIAGYYAHCTALDACFGRLMTTLQESGAAENTLVIFSSDHGDMLYSQDRGWKSKPWAESALIPMIARWPGQIAPGRLSDAPVGLVDMMPTLLGAAGVPVPAGVDGADLGALLRGDEAAAPASQFINYPVSPKIFSYPEWRGVITHTHTYARFREAPWVLYDDVADPHQLRNLADDPAAAALRDGLETELQGWLERLGDPFEDSDAVAAQYYPGGIDGVIPVYDNALITAGKLERRERWRGIYY